MLRKIDRFGGSAVVAIGACVAVHYSGASEIVGAVVVAGALVLLLGGFAGVAAAVRSVSND